ncbi:MAG: methyltransferase domain-containing protein [Chloroflexia bacterium]
MDALGPNPSQGSDLDRLVAEYERRARQLAGSDLYSPFNLGYLFTIQQRQRAVLDMLRRHGFDSLSGKRILEVGCGKGQVLHELLGEGACPETLHGTDLILSRVQEAHHLLPNVGFTCADAQRLPYRSDAFDVVLQFTVFSSVLDPGVKKNLAGEMLRVLRKGGMVVWYDFWLNPFNKQTSGIRPAEVRALFPGCRFDFRRITLAPPLSRRLAPRAWLLCYILESLRLFNTHYLVGIRK